MAEDDRQFWVGVAGFLAGLGTAALAVGIAMQQQRGNPLIWWVFAGVFIALAVAIAVMGVARPWFRARKLWNEALNQPVDSDWRAGHLAVPNGLVLVVLGAEGTQARVVSCEVTRRGSTSQLLSIREDATSPPLVDKTVSHFPSGFVSAEGRSAPAFDHLPHGCYVQVWWAWDGPNKRKFPLAREVFPIWPSGRRPRWAKKCERLYPTPPSEQPLLSGYSQDEPRERSE